MQRPICECLVFDGQISQTGRNFTYLIDNLGTAVDFGPITGQINRENKTWEFETASAPKFRAKLINGNMVDGTVNFPGNIEGPFYANYTN